MFEVFCGAGVVAGGVFVEAGCPVMPMRTKKTMIAPPKYTKTSLRDLSFRVDGFTSPTIMHTTETNNRIMKRVVIFICFDFLVGQRPFRNIDTFSLRP